MCKSCALLCFQGKRYQPSVCILVKFYGSYEFTNSVEMIFLEVVSGVLSYSGRALNFQPQVSCWM